MIRIERVDGRWRWVFTDAGKDLVSNEDFGSREEAVASARRAYPGTTIDERPRRAKRSAEQEQEGGAADKIARWLALVVVLIAWSRRSRGGR